MATTSVQVTIHIPLSPDGHGASPDNYLHCCANNLRATGSVGRRNEAVVDGGVVALCVGGGWRFEEFSPARGCGVERAGRQTDQRLHSIGSWGFDFDVKMMDDGIIQ